MTTLYLAMDAICRALSTSGVVRWVGMPDPAPPPSRWITVSDVTVRRLNVLVALVGIVVLLPLMVVIARAVRLTSTGPILFQQERVGHDRRRVRSGGNRKGHRDPATYPAISRRARDTGARIFTMYQFRTMKACTKGSVSRESWASPDDYRITPVGSFLRRYRLDERPQLLNVLPRGRPQDHGTNPPRHDREEGRPLSCRKYHEWARRGGDLCR
jgi:hypothetical protein